VRGGTGGGGGRGRRPKPLDVTYRSSPLWNWREGEWRGGGMEGRGTGGDRLTSSLTDCTSVVG
jgi:hypothetical protein